MPLRKQPPQQACSFDAERLERLSKSMQPLMHKNYTDKELEAIIKDADVYWRRMNRSKSWISRFFGRY